jgi:prepilin-type N-terminal cleavage/methylation domain-containing protein
MLTIKQSRGVTLIELMVAMVISTIVLLGVGTV